MPTYDYRCTQCNEQFEAKHRVNDASPACSNCGGVCEKLILSPPATHGYKVMGRQQAIDSLQAKVANNSHQHSASCNCKSASL